MRQLSLFKGKRQRGVKAPRAKEIALHGPIADILRQWSSPGWRYTHIPSGEKRDVITAVRLKRMGLRRGWPDFILLSPRTLAHFLELKREGEQLNDDQEEFGTYCNEHGYPHAVADTFNDAMAVLKHWRAVRVTVGV